MRASPQEGGDAIVAAQQYLKAKCEAAAHEVTLASNTLKYWQQRNVADALTLMKQEAQEAERNAEDARHHAWMAENARRSAHHIEHFKLLAAFATGAVLAACCAVILFR